MKQRYKIIVWMMVGSFFTISAHSQSGQRMSNSLRVQYGLYQFNNGQSGFIGKDNNDFLSMGLAYRHQLGRVSGINVTGRYYEWHLKEGTDLKTYAIQAMWVLHARRISANWRLNRFTPYAGVGLGRERHRLNKASELDTTFSNFYLPLEAGVLYNMNSRWSIGIFSEFKIASAGDVKEWINNNGDRMDIVNTAGISLAWHFGKKNRITKMPVVYTNPWLQTDKAIVQNKSLINKKKEEPSIAVIKKKELLSFEKAVIDTLPDITRMEVTITESDIHGSMNKFQKDSLERVSGFKSTPLFDSLSNIDNKAVIDNAPKGNMPIVDSSKLNMVIYPEKNTEDSNAYEKRMDSLMAIINQFEKRLNNMKISGDKVPVPSKDTIIIRMTEEKLYDEPVIDKLKQVYNKLEEMENRNYHGDNNEEEFRNLNRELNKTRQDLLHRAEVNEMALKELAEFSSIMSALQNERNLKSQEGNNSGNYEMQKEIVRIQNNLDMVLRDIEHIKGIESERQKSAEDSVLNQLTKNQAELEEKIRIIGQQNLKLAGIIDSLSKKEETSFVSIPVTGKEERVTTINFGLNLSEVKKEYKAVLKNLADSIMNLGNKMVLISGFADKSGNATYNLRLSQKRVRAVKNELIKYGVKNDFFIERYFGSMKADERINENDRKVVIRLLTQ
ncbi:MAG: OmpA family protein [Chitinophagaceae bacterium]